MPAHDKQDIEVFADGNMADVIRRGNSVFRGRGLWSDAAHQVLRHLEIKGVSWVPRLLSVADDQEELSFIPGDSIPASLDGYEDETYLVQVGRLIRELHDAMEDFRFEPGTECVPMTHGTALPTVVCHQDVGPWNVIVRGETISGLIDWDLVGPATPVWELAYAAWRFAPIYPEGRRTGFTPAEQAQRTSLLLDAYGLSLAERQGFVESVLERMRSAIETVDNLGRAGVPGFTTLLDSGLHLSGHDDMKWLQRHRQTFTRLIG